MQNDPVAGSHTVCVTLTTKQPDVVSGNGENHPCNGFSEAAVHTLGYSLIIEYHKSFIKLRN